MSAFGATNDFRGHYMAVTTFAATKGGKSAWALRLSRLSRALYGFPVPDFWLWRKLAEEQPFSVSAVLVRSGVFWWFYLLYPR